jgi:RNA polymerase sigma-70 factor (ECF subfamily)
VELNLRARVRAGDPEAFGELFEENARAVYNHAFRLTADWAVAEDAVSLTFLEAWRHRGVVEPEGGSLRPWLLGITVNVVRNMSRAARRHRAALERLPPAPPVPDFADELAGRMDDAIALRRVQASLRGLRRGEREVVALCVWAGLDYAQAAAALGVAVGTVRSRLSRARANLRKLVAANGPVDREPGERGGQEQDGRENATRSLQEVPDA